MTHSSPPIPQISFDRVSLKAPLGPRYLLKDISFRLMEGDRLALIGASGSGKTSLLRLMNRLIDPSEGDIFYGDRALKTYPVVELRQSMPVVFQEPRLLGMSVRDAIAYPLTLRKLKPEVIKQRLEKWLERLRIPDEWLTRTDVQLSVGQKQMVAIARALISEPSLLILDEPTSALDVGRRSHLTETLIHYSQTTTCTMVMVSHDLEIAQAFSTKLLHLTNGHISQYSATQDVDWIELKETLIQTQQAEQGDWDDDDESLESLQGGI